MFRQRYAATLLDADALIYFADVTLPLSIDADVFAAAITRRYAAITPRHADV